MKEDQGPNYVSKSICSKSLPLPEGVTVTGACELLRLLSEELGAIKLPNGDEIKITHTLRDSDGTYHRFATLLRYFPQNGKV
jgi:hypothetical protein